MNHLERALETAESIRDALASEIERAREARDLIRDMDAEGLFVRAAKRAELNQRVACLQLALAESLKEAGRELGLDDVTTDALGLRAPTFGRRFTAFLAEVRALARELRGLDDLNRQLAQRALSYVRAHLAVLCPRPAAYDRRGGNPAAARTSTLVRVA